MDELNAFERSIANELALMGGPPANVDAAGIAAGIAGAAPRSGSGRRRGVLLVVGVAVVVGLFAFLLLSGILSGDPDPAEDLRSAGAATIAPGATVTPAPRTPQPSVAGVSVTTPRVWTRTSLPMDERADVAALAVHPNGRILMVAAATDLIDRPHGWLSRDGGRTWARTNLGLRRRHDAVPRAATVWDGLFVIVGDSADGGFVQTSSDGLRWKRAATIGRAELRGIEATAAGLVAHGYDVGGRQRERRYHPAIFTSDDGSGWERQRIASVGSPARQARRTDLQTIGLARSDDGVILVPGLHVNGGVEGLIAPDDVGVVGVTSLEGLYWRSTDGSTWTAMRLPIEHESTSAGPDYVRVTDIRWTPSGFLMALQAPDVARSSRVGSIWHSTDGLEWEQVADTGRSVVGEIVSDGPDFMAFTAPVAERNSAGEWLVANALDRELISSDGTRWRPTEDPAFMRFAVRDGSISMDGTIVALGHALVPGEPESKAAPAWELLVGSERDS